MSDIRWHDIKQVMPGTNFDNENNNFTDFLLRYSWEPDLSDCFFGVGFLSDGKFIAVFPEDEEHDHQPTLTHWALIDHPYD